MSPDTKSQKCSDFSDYQTRFHLLKTCQCQPINLSPLASQRAFSIIGPHRIPHRHTNRFRLRVAEAFVKRPHWEFVLVFACNHSLKPSTVMSWAGRIDKLRETDRQELGEGLSSRVTSSSVTSSRGSTSRELEQLIIESGSLAIQRVLHVSVHGVSWWLVSVPRPSQGRRLHRDTFIESTLYTLGQACCQGNRRSGRSAF
jgi:hypothetical protein